ncbi:MAG: hypothetical protein AB1736_02620 [Chloroflexota bacterium]
MDGWRRWSAIVALVAMLVAGCGAGSSPQPSLEPRDEVVAALRSTADLQTVHALLRIEVGGLADETTTLTIEGDVDIAARELDVTAAFVPEVFGATGGRFVVVDGLSFSRQDDAEWSISGDGVSDPLAMVPTTARIAEVIEAALRDPATTIRREGVEDCGDARCDRIRAEIPADVAWLALNRMIRPEGQPEASLQPLPSGFPGFAIDLWIEQGSHRLRQATNTTVVDRTTISIVVALSAHDEPVTIRPPIEPPASR